MDITQVEGGDILERLANAQTRLARAGGGVVYFPAGVYHINERIPLRDGVVLRGANPPMGVSARDAAYAPPSRLEFPRYLFFDRGEGTPVESAFKGIYVQNPAECSDCGVVNLDIDHGHILLEEAEGHRGGRNRFVFGCRLRNAALPNRQVPDVAMGQKPWQRYTATWDHAAIQVFTAENGLIANNRLAKSGEDNFTMNGYVLLDRGGRPQAMDGVIFDYDNRAGIYLNHYGIGGPGGQGPKGTPETHPHGFRKGLVIRDNYLFNTGRCAIGFCGDGVECRKNVIRFARNVWRPTVTGRHLSHGADTNDNRAVEMRGWRWVVDGNDYEVYRNLCADRVYPINDGEGLMHEDHVNSIVKDSVLTNNRGNAYISIFKTAGIEGLLVESNEIRIDEGAGSEAAIMVAACRVNEGFCCRNVRFLNNTVSGRGILIEGTPEESTGNLIRGNKAVGQPFGKEGHVIQNQANATVENNEGFKVVASEWMSYDQLRRAREQGSAGKK